MTQPTSPEQGSAQHASGTNRWYLSTAPIVRALVHLCAPMAAALMVSAVYNLINAGVIGAVHDTALLAAVTLGSPVLGLIMAVGDLFGTGGGALISRLLGASEHDASKAGDIRRVASFAVFGAFATGVLLGVLGLFLLDPLIVLLGADGAAVPATRAYISVMLAFLPVLTAAFCLEQVVRAEGAARQVMTGLIASTAANLLLDILFILVLHWGVAGAALATGLANLGVSVYFVAWLHRHSDHIRIAPKWFTFTPAKPVLGVGAGTLIQSGFLIVTSLVLNNLAAAYGDGPLAAMGVAVRIAQIPEFLIMGITLGVLPLLSYSYGKGDRQRFTAALRAAALAVGCIAAFFFLAVFLFRSSIVAAFVPDSSVLAVGIAILTAQLAAMVANGFTGLLTSTFQATGQALAATVTAAVQGALFIPVVLFGSLWFGLAGIIWSLTFTEGAALGIGLIMWAARRKAIERGLAGGTPERAEEVLQDTEG